MEQYCRNIKRQLLEKQSPQRLELSPQSYNDMASNLRRIRKTESKKAKENKAIETQSWKLPSLIDSWNRVEQSKIMTRPKTKDQICIFAAIWNQKWAQRVYVYLHCLIYRV